MKKFFFLVILMSSVILLTGCSHRSNTPRNEVLTQPASPQVEEPTPMSSPISSPTVESLEKDLNEIQLEEETFE